MIDRYNIVPHVSHDWDKEKDEGGIFVLAEDHDRVVAEMAALILMLQRGAAASPPDFIYVGTTTGNGGAAP